MSQHHLGRAAAIDVDTVVVGAPGEDGAAGAAYVFERVGGVWVEGDKLTASDRAAGDSFGLELAISGSSIVVGALGNDDNGTNSGSAYVFVDTPDGWVQEAKLTAADGEAFDNLGSGVDIDGNNIVLSASNDDDAGEDAGAAYVFTRSRSGWQQRAKLTASDATTGDRFGIAGRVSISGPTIAVTVTRPVDTQLQGPGAVYVFERHGRTWQEADKLHSEDASAGLFGYSVAIDGDRAIVGALLAPAGRAVAAGAAFVFER